MQISVSVTHSKKFAGQKEFSVVGLETFFLFKSETFFRLKSMSDSSQDKHCQIETSETVLT